MNMFGTWFGILTDQAPRQSSLDSTLPIRAMEAFLAQCNRQMSQAFCLDEEITTPPGRADETTTGICRTAHRG